MDAQELKRREELAAQKREVAHWATPSGKWWVTLHVDGLGIFTYDATNSGGTLGKMTEDEAMGQMSRMIIAGDFQTGKTPVQRVERDGSAES